MMATRVSWGFAEMTISFDIIEAPIYASERDGAHLCAKPTGAREGCTFWPPRRIAWEEPKLQQGVFLLPMHSKTQNLNSRRDFNFRGGPLIFPSLVDEPLHADIHHQAQCQKYER